MGRTQVSTSSMDLVQPHTPLSDLGFAICQIGGTVVSMKCASCKGLCTRGFTSGLIRPPGWAQAGGDTCAGHRCKAVRGYPTSSAQTSSTKPGRTLALSVTAV